MICGITPIKIGAAGAVLGLVLVFDATHSLADSVLLAGVRRIDGSRYLADDRVINILVLVRCRDSYTAFRLNPPYNIILHCHTFPSISFGSRCQRDQQSQFCQFHLVSFDPLLPHTFILREKAGTF
jgi:hypothetical protein